MKVYVCVIKGCINSFLMSVFITSSCPSTPLLPANMRHWSNVGAVLGHRLRHRPNMDPTLEHKHKTLIQCWINVGPSSTTLALHWSNIGSLCLMLAGVRSCGYDQQLSKQHTLTLMLVYCCNNVVGCLS